MYLIVLLLQVIATATEGTSYNYNIGGADWGNSFTKCNGLEQSPIDIKSAQDTNCQTRSLEVDFHSDTVSAKVGNVSSAFKTENDQATLKLKKGDLEATYKLLQFHIHTPSEHTIKGKFADAEIHFVFQYQEGKRPAGDLRNITVLGFMFNHQAGSSNEFLDLWNVDSVKDTTLDMSLEYFEDLIDDEKINAYYHYDGSFTTPTCDEVVNWIVFKDILPMSTSQLDAIKKYFQNDPNFGKGNGNNRIPMPLNKRVVGQQTLTQCEYHSILTLAYILMLSILIW